MTKISETEHFILELASSETISTCNISAKYTDGNKQIAQIFLKHNLVLEVQPIMMSVGTAIIDAIVSWELYQEFAKLVDEAVDLVKKQGSRN